MNPFFRKMRVPTKGHKAIIHLFNEMNHQQISASDLSKRAGLGFHTIWDWRDRRSPSVNNLEAALNALGFELVVVKRKDEDVEENS